MIILGLTGSIGIGKSTAAAMLRRRGVPVHDSDATVHRLFRPGGAAVAPIAQAFPGVVVDGAVDRRALGARVFGQPTELRRLEAIVHPLVRQAENRFLAIQARARRPLVVLDIPLLFETGGQFRCDAVAVVSATAFLQRQRVLRRPGMTAARLADILRQQTPDRLKRRWADAVIPTGLGRRLSLHHLDHLLAQLRSQHPTAWGPHARNRPRYRNHRA